MNKAVHQAAKELVERAQAGGHVGKSISREDMVQLVSDMGGRFPSWLAELLTSVPLCGIELGWQADEPEDDYDGVSWLVISDAAGIRGESVECYPGLAILEHGYINIGSCSLGSGDPYFISTEEGEDPPVYQVYHDVSDEAEMILAEGRRLVSDSLSMFFRQAKLEPTA